MDDTAPRFKKLLEIKNEESEIFKRTDILNEEETEEFLKMIEENENVPSYPKSSEETLEKAREIAKENEEPHSRDWEPSNIRDNTLSVLRREQREQNYSDPVIYKIDGWYFYDLFFSNLNGPFETELEARFGFRNYEEMVENLGSD